MSASQDVIARDKKPIEIWKRISMNLVTNLDVLMLISRGSLTGGMLTYHATLACSCVLKSLSLS